MGLILESAINLNKEMHLKPNVVSQINKDVNNVGQKGAKIKGIEKCL